MNPNFADGLSGPENYELSHGHGFTSARLFDISTSIFHVLEQIIDILGALKRKVSYKYYEEEYKYTGKNDRANQPLVAYLAQVAYHGQTT